MRGYRFWRNKIDFPIKENITDETIFSSNDTTRIIITSTSAAYFCISTISSAFKKPARELIFYVIFEIKNVYQYNQERHPKQKALFPLFHKVIVYSCPG